MSLPEKSPESDAGGSYTKTTHEVRVTVEPAHIEANTDPMNNVYAFSYTVTIENLGPLTVQLLERHWVITSAGVQSAEVVGPGVVGVQPVLEPGQSFRYTSGAVINDPFGSMIGSYSFRRSDGSQFEVEIPKFELVYPVMVH